MCLIDEVKEMYERGLEGLNEGLILDEFGKFVLSKATYILFGSHSGVGKSSFIDTFFVLKAYQACKRQNKDFKIVLRSLERKEVFRAMKWVCMFMKEDFGLTISFEEIRGVYKNKKNIEYRPQIEKCFDKLKIFLQNVEIIRKDAFPDDIKDFIINDVETLKVKEKDFYYIHITDHVGKLLKPKGFDVKQTIDKHSANMGALRDEYNIIPIDVSQFNRSIGQSLRDEQKTPKPQVEDFKDSSNLQENADLVLALFYPHKYNLTEYNGYKLSKFRFETESKKVINRLRTLHFLKSSFGEDSVDYGVTFHGESGLMKIIKDAKDMTEVDYQNAAKFNYEKTF